MGKQAREVYLDKYTPETNYQSLMAIYRVAVGDKKAKSYFKHES